MADNKKTEIFNKVSEIVADHFDVDRAKITDDLNLKTDLDADSIDFVEFVLELEDTFGEEINDEDIRKHFHRNFTQSCFGITHCGGSVPIDRTKVTMTVY